MTVFAKADSQPPTTNSDQHYWFQVNCLLVSWRARTWIRVAHFFEINEISRQRTAKGKLYLEFLRVPALSAGVYVLPKGALDPQKPHREDELYYVVRGRARMKIGPEDAEVHAGAVIFVEAEAEHRFYDIQEELEVLVFFAPAEQE